MKQTSSFIGAENPNYQIEINTSLSNNNETQLYLLKYGKTPSIITEDKISTSSFLINLKEQYKGKCHDYYYIKNNINETDYLEVPPA